MMENQRFPRLNFVKQNLGGFTLVELLVVTAIILLLTALILPNFRVGEREFALQRSANKLSQDIRKAQQMAMSAKEYLGSLPPGYGIYLTQGNSYYLLYADTNPAAGNEKYDGGDSIVEKIYLEKKVYIKDVSPASLSINFKPPDPKIRISGTGVDETSIATITLALETDPTKTKIIKVNKAGLIYVE